ncbi:MAG: hypothetical protein AAGA29_08285 [Planctomycetota bacterium]
MQLQQAVEIIKQKFIAETQDKLDGPEFDAYSEAFEKFPVMMEVATYCWADQIVQQNYEARRQQALKQAQEQGGDVTPQGTA